MSTTTRFISNHFFAQDACLVAQALLGKVLRHRVANIWLCARIIETEAYYLTDKASHASLGYTEKRRALFMPAGTIYMYYARGGDSFNISAQGEGNAVLIKSGFPWTIDNLAMINKMQELNPLNGRLREPVKLCQGQTLLCRSLGLKVPEWNQKNFTKQQLELIDVGVKVKDIIQTTRLGIPLGRDEDKPFRFIDAEYRYFCTKNPRSHRTTTHE